MCQWSRDRRTDLSPYFFLLLDKESSIIISNISPFFLILVLLYHPSIIHPPNLPSFLPSFCIKTFRALTKSSISNEKIAHLCLSFIHVHVHRDRFGFFCLPWSLTSDKHMHRIHVAFLLFAPQMFVKYTV